MNRLRLLADPDLELTVVDLRLFARLSLEPHRRQFRPLPLRAIRLEKPLHLAKCGGFAQFEGESAKSRILPKPLRRRGKCLGLKPGLELCLCKPPGAGATLNQDSKWRFRTCVPNIND